MMNIIKPLFLLFCISTISFQVSANPEIEKTLVNRITQSQSELQVLQKKMMQEGAQYAAQLDKQQQEIKALREKAAVIRRQKDEQLLSFDQLKTRVDQWTSQSNYQKSLLTHYMESSRLMGMIDDENKLTPAALQVIVADTQQKLNPQWANFSLVAPSGDVVESQFIALGGVKIAYNAELNLAGIVSDLENESRIQFRFNSRQKEGIAELHSSNAGVVSFDPTLGKAFELIGHNDTIIGHIEKGGAWAIPIVLFGLVALIISLLKTIEFIRLPKLDKELADTLTSTTQNTFELKNKMANASAPQRRLLEIVKNTDISQQRDDFMVAYLMEYKHKVERFMNVVSVTAAIAPLLGLLGTVSGMISTFKMMTIFGTGDASTVSGGISIALITTELGLIVAIPSLIASALLSRKIKTYLHDLESFAIKISKIKLS